VVGATGLGKPSDALGAKCKRCGERHGGLEASGYPQPFACEASLYSPVSSLAMEVAKGVDEACRVADETGITHNEALSMLCVKLAEGFLRAARAADATHIAAVQS